MRTLLTFKTPVKTLLVALAAVAALSVTLDASARGGRSHGGFHGGGRGHIGLFIGAPLLAAPFFYGPRYYYPPAYYPPAYYPPVAMAPQYPPQYVEQQPQGAIPGPTSDGYWYFCPSSQAYYPSVNQCAQPWQRVAPTS